MNSACSFIFKSSHYGSVKNKKGTSALVMEPTHQKQSEIYMRGAGPVDGDPGFLNSTRAERSRFIGLIYAIHQIAQKYDLRQGKLIMYVENISSFQQGDPLSRRRRSAAPL